MKHSNSNAVSEKVSHLEAKQEQNTGKWETFLWTVFEFVYVITSLVCSNSHTIYEKGKKYDEL